MVIRFLYVREKCYPLPDISGEWIVCTTTIESSYKPFRYMRLTYRSILLCEGSSIAGTSEKIFEESSEKNGSYTGKDRTRGQISGSIEKKYFSNDRIKLHIVEFGENRESTIYYDLKCKSGKLMKGKFFATAGDSKGYVNWKRRGSCE